MKSRRNFLGIGTGAGLVGIAIYLGIPACSPVEQKPSQLPKEKLAPLSMKEFLQEHVFKKHGKDFSHPYYPQSSDDSESLDAFNALQNTFVEKYGDADNIKITCNYKLRELDVSDTAFAEYSKQVQSLAKQFFTDLGLEVPTITITKLAENIPIQPEEGIRKMFVVEGKNKHFSFEKDGKVLDEYADIRSTSVAGEAGGDGQYLLHGQKISIHYERGPLLIVLSSSGDPSRDTLSTVDTNLSELLHYHTMMSMVKYLEREVNEKHQDKVGKLDHAILKESMNKWIDLEEGVVHAITFKWIKENWLPQQRDISDKDLEACLSPFDQHSQYRLLRPFLLQAISPRELLRTYLNDPEKLIK